MQCLKSGFARFHIISSDPELDPDMDPDLDPGLDPDLDPGISNSTKMWGKSNTSKNLNLIFMLQ